MFLWGVTNIKFSMENVGFHAATTHAYKDKFQPISRTKIKKTTSNFDMTKLKWSPCVLNCDTCNYPRWNKKTQLATVLLEFRDDSQVSNQAREVWTKREGFSQESDRLGSEKQSCTELREKLPHKFREWQPSME